MREREPQLHISCHQMKLQVMGLGASNGVFGHSGPMGTPNYPSYLQDYRVFSINQCSLLKTPSAQLIEHKVYQVCTKTFSPTDYCFWYQKVLCMLAKQECKQQPSY